MEEEQHKKLMKQRGVVKGMLTHMQAFIKTSTPDPYELQVRLNRLPNIFTKFETAHGRTGT
jgi:predicted DNA-binding protein (UPF0278 family)